MVEEEEWRREKSLRGWMAGRNAAQEQSDQIRSDHGMPFSQQATAWVLGYRDAWMDTQLHGTIPRKK